MTADAELRAWLSRQVPDDGVVTLDAAELRAHRTAYGHTDGPPCRVIAVDHIFRGRLALLIRELHGPDCKWRVNGDARLARVVECPVGEVFIDSPAGRTIH